MIRAFILIAGSLAAAAAVLLLLPLLRRRSDAQPASALAAAAVLGVILLGGAGLYATFSNYGWVDGDEYRRYAGGDDRKAGETAGE